MRTLRYYLAAAEEIVELADRLEEAFIARNADVSGVISIGATEAVGSRMFAKLIKQFSDKYPLVQFHLFNEMADYIKERMDKGLIDVGLLLEPIDTSKYDFIRLSQKEAWAVLFVWMEHWPSIAVRNCVLFLSVRNIQRAVC